MPTLLEIIAKARRDETLLWNIQEISTVENSEFRDLNNNYGNDEAIISRTPIPTITNQTGIEDIADNRINETADRNLLQPQDGYERYDLIEDLNVVDSGDLLDIAQEQRNEDNPTNEFGNWTTPINIESEDTIFTERYENYLEYFESINPNAIYSFDNIGRIIDGTFTFDDTDLGNIAAEQWRQHLVTKSIAGTKRLVLGRLNTNLFTLGQGEPLYNEDFIITKSNSLLGQGQILIQRILGLNLPFNERPENLFGLEQDNLSAGRRNTNILEYTGKAYQNLVFTNFQKNKYYPEIEIYDNQNTNNETYISLNEDWSFNTDLFSSKNIQTLNQNANGTFNLVSEPFIASGYGIEYKNRRDVNVVDKDVINSNYSLGIKDTQAFRSDWTKTGDNNFIPDTLLYKTKELILKNTNAKYIDNFATEFLESKNGIDYFLSKGGSVTTKEGFTHDDGTVFKENDFFRVFTKARKMNQLNRIISHRGLDTGERSSSLGLNGIPIYAPTVRGDVNNNTPDFKQYMFSISNSAWKHDIASLPECEKYISPDGEIYRQMWFAPYDLSINENSSQDVTSTPFLGRGEPVYTANYSERTASVSFALLVDYPSVINSIRGEKKQIWERYFMGDKSVQAEINQRIADRLTPVEQNKLNQLKASFPKNNNKLNNPNTNIDGNEKNENLRQFVISAFFPNEVFDTPVSLENGSVFENAGYEDGFTILNQTYLSGRIKNSIQYRDLQNYSLNVDFYENYYNRIETELLKAAEKSPTAITFYITGHASAATTTRINNKDLSQRRAENIQTWLEGKLFETGLINLLGEDMQFIYKIEAKSDNEDAETIDDTEGDRFEAKYARRVDITISVEDEKNDTIDNSIDAQIADIAVDDPFVIDNNIPVPELDDDLFDKIFIDGCDVFKFLEGNDPISFSTISEKISYFNKTYHSYTPQNFNQRLTFLQQCLRSGSNIVYNDGDKQNLWFGTQSFVYLSIGDWFRTKAIITDLDIDYNAYTDGTANFDLNPDSVVGIQPMFAKISLKFKIIGGQSMEGAIKKTQTALSFNYYSNTHTYDIRADKTVYSQTGDFIQSKVIDGFRAKQNNNVDEIEKRRLLAQQGYVSTNNGIELTETSQVNIGDNQNEETIERTYNVERIREILNL